MLLGFAVTDLKYICSLIALESKLIKFLGSPPQRNKHHIPHSDGCGSLGLQIDSQYLPIAEMTICCDAHDICYDTCNSDKELCDIEFKRCLYKYCDTYEKTVGDLVMKGNLLLENHYSSLI